MCIYIIYIYIYCDDYSSLVSEVKHETFQVKGIKVLTPKQLLQRLPLTSAQVKTGNASNDLLNEI